MAPGHFDVWMSVGRYHLGSFRLHLKTLAEIQLAADRVVDQEIFRAFAFDPAFEYEVGAIHDRKGFAHVVVGDENGQAGLEQIHDDLLHVVNGARIHAAERLVEHEQCRLGHKRTRDGEPALFTAAQRDGEILRDPFDPELVEQVLATLFSLVLAQWQGLQNGHDVLFDCHFAKDRFFLGEITHPEPRPFVHGISRHVLAGKDDAPAVWPNESYDHVETRRLPGAIRP